MKGFMEFVREQGVVGLAVGFILGGAVAKMVTAVVTDLINPLIGLALGKLDLKSYYFMAGSAKFMWGDFLSVLIDFLVIAMVVYFGVKWLKLDKLDKKKS
jgi:large conductance mechanosensitive channel